MTLQQLTSHVAAASGVGSENPESHVSVIIAPFAVEPPDTTPHGILAFLANVPDWVVLAAIGGLVLFIILLIIILLLRRRSKKKKQARLEALEAEQRAAEEAAAAAAAAEILAAAPTGGADIMEVNTEKSMELRKNVRQFAQNNPEIAAQMVKAWLKGEDVNG
jgi:flagellar M-ring protein FliF